MWYYRVEKNGNCLTPYQKDLPKKAFNISKFNLSNNFDILVQNSTFSEANEYAKNTGNYSLLHHKLWFQQPKTSTSSSG